MKKFHFSLTDRQIRPALHSYLEQINENLPDTRIVNELDLCQGCSRVDIAVVNGLLHGYEIKSEVDSLSRLPNQIKHYNKTLEKVTVAIALSQFEKVISKIPDWWGVLLVHNQHNRIIINEYREALSNPSIDTNSLLSLLWKSELLAILEEHQLILKKNLPKKILRETLLQRLDAPEVSYEVCKALKSRKNWRS